MSYFKEEISAKDFLTGNIPNGTVVTWRERGTEMFVYPAVKVKDGWRIKNRAWGHRELCNFLVEGLLEEGLSCLPYMNKTGPFPLEFISTTTEDSHGR